jgi:proteasome assembly chaperone (PAC2) family protein
MWIRLQTHIEERSLRDPLLIVCLSTADPQFRLLYSQAKELGRFLQRKLDFKLMASLYSSALPPEVKVNEDGVASLISNNFYLCSSPTRDFVLLTGHSSPIDDQYEYGDTILSYAEKLGVKELVSFGARWTETVASPLEDPKVTGFASDEDGAKRLSEAGVSILKNESAFYFGNVIVSLSRFHGIRAYKISVDHGEPSPNPKSIIAFMGVLSRMFNLSADVSDLNEQSKLLADEIKRAEIEGVSSEDEPKNSQSDDIYR